MPPKKQTVSEEAFHSFKREFERNSQYLVDQLLQKINKLEEKCIIMEEENNKKIEEKCVDMENENNKKSAEKYKQIENQYNTEIEKINDNIQNLRKMFVEQKQNTNIMNNEQKCSNIEISKPIFFGNNKDQHPIDFLQNLEEYFKVKQINNEEKLLIIRDCLKNAAGNWFATVRFQIRRYSEFRDAFIDEFWSREIQIQTWRNCLNTSQVPSNITYREHFAQWSTKLRHLQVP